MDVGYLKIRIDIKAEYDEYRKKYNFKRKELKREEVKKVFDGFKEFFKSDKHFKFKENDHSVIAEYKDHGITLDMDIYKNVDAPDFKLEGTIKTYDKQVYGFTVEGIPNKEIFEAPYVDDHEKMIHDTHFFKQFLEDEVVYTFRYNITGHGETYPTMQAMMLAL
jgi:hypothetical protein